MEVKILQLIEGAKAAQGLTVIIDVFRAFSLECYMFHNGASRIIPIGDINEAYRLKNEDNSKILVGERGGAICEGFDYGNSPSQIKNVSLKDKVIVHTTSAGTQGISNALHAEEIIAGSLVNAKAIAEYIKRKNPKRVTLVGMGNAGVEEAKEDILCANYIYSMLKNEDFDIKTKIQDLKINGGAHFFLPQFQEVFPEEDFWMCTNHDIFPYVLKVNKDNAGMNYITKEMVI